MYYLHCKYALMHKYRVVRVLMSVQSSNEEARQLLEKEMEKFLARGGEITELERGYTAFPDGNIPKIGQIHASMTAEEREARNAEARQARELEAERKRAERAKYQEEQRKKREAEKKERRAREAQEAAWFKRELQLAAQEEAKEIARKEAAHRGSCRNGTARTPARERTQRRPFEARA